MISRASNRASRCHIESAAHRPRSNPVCTGMKSGSNAVMPGVRVERVQAVNRNEPAGTRTDHRYLEVFPGVGDRGAVQTPPSRRS